MKRKQILLNTMCSFLLTISLAYAGPEKTIEDEDDTSKITARRPKRDQELPQIVPPEPLRVLFLPGNAEHSITYYHESGVCHWRFSVSSQVFSVPEAPTSELFVARLQEKSAP